MNATGDGIAIVGASLRLPGATNLEELWSLLLAGRSAIKRLDEATLSRAGISETERLHPNFVPYGSLLEGVELFDAELFGMSAREARLTDPQHRLFLECAWEALEDGALLVEATRRPTGVFAGAGFNSYLPRLLSRDGGFLFGPERHEILVGNDKDFLATRVAYKLDLRGPAVTVQCACSTSLAAVHLACQSLLAAECDLALAGGVTVLVPQGTGYRYVEGGVLSPDGACRSFDRKAAGTVFGSGVGVVALKRLAEALTDGDPIHAVLLATAMSNDGAGRIGFTAPSVEGQAEVIATALATAGVEPAQIGYLEAHGTGTALGDPIELAALNAAFGLGLPPGSIPIGSIKTNLGHLDAAAGIAGLFKAMLIVRHGQIPRSLNFSAPNPKLELERGPFAVAAHAQAWPAGKSPRLAGVSSFGMGGTNVHAVVGEPPATANEPATAGPELLLLSARTRTALVAHAERLSQALTDELPLAAVARTLASGRRQLGERLAVVVHDSHEARHALAGPALDRARSRHALPPKVAFLFPGQGAQHPGMAAGLAARFPIFSRELTRCLELLAPHLPATGRLEHALGLDSASDATALAATEWSQPAIFAVSWALSAQWRHWGVEPATLLGHSLGEWVAATVAGTFRLEEAAAMVALRGRLMAAAPRGGMLAVPRSEATVRDWLAEFPGSLTLSVVNGPERMVVAGEEEALRDFTARCQSEGVATRRLSTSHAFHTPAMAEASAALVDAVSRCHLAAPDLPWISNLSGLPIAPEEAVDPGYWGRQMLHPVRFGDGLAALFRAPDLLLLEVGPGRSLAALSESDPRREPRQRTMASLPDPRRFSAAPETLLEAAGALWCEGVELDLEAIFPRGGRLRLPTYAFERRRHWPEELRAPAVSAAALPAAAPPATADDSERLIALLEEQLGLMARQLEVLRAQAATGGGLAELGGSLEEMS